MYTNRDDNEPEDDQGWDLEPEAEQPEETDPLAELDEPTRALVTSREQAAAARALAQARTNMRSAGFDLSEDLQPVIANPTAAMRWLGPGEERPAQPAPQQAQAPAQPVENDDDDIPDPLSQPREFRQWMRAEQKRSAEQMMQPVVGAIQKLDQRFAARELAAVTRQAAEAVQQHAPAIAYITEHPDFAPAMKELLSRVDPDQWSDPLNLARLAGSLIPDLGEPPQSYQRPAPRQATGARTAQSVVSRAAGQAAGPSRDSGRGPKKPPVNELHQAVAARLSLSTGRKVTAEEIAMQSVDPSGDVTREMRRKRLASEMSR